MSRGIRATASTSTATRPALVASLTVAALCLATAAEAQPWRRNRAYPDGQIVTIGGRVTSADGTPIANLDVRLEASRKSFSVRRMRSVEENVESVRTRTDANGDYRIDWPWHHYYTAFRVVAYVPIRSRGGHDRAQVLGLVELSERITEGTPVSAPITIADTRLLEQVRAFLATLDTADERRVYDEEGKPDRVETVGFSELEEETWWYFALGALYRFRDGRLVEVENFEPIRGFDR